MPNDPVRPDHYHRGTPHEVIPVISAWKLNFNRGNVIKYVARAHLKGQELNDLRKAREYLDREIALLESEVPAPRSTAPARPPPTTVPGPGRPRDGR